MKNRDRCNINITQYDLSYFFRSDIMKQGLEPIYNENTEILILGSAPSEKSLELQQYYGNKGNFFWRIIFSCLNTNDPIDYQERLKLLKENKIGLWDIFGRFDRKGSLDSNFVTVKLNHFDKILSETSIKLIIANGNTAHQQIAASNIFNEYRVIKCLSTSGANNRKMVERQNEWHAAIQPFLF